MIGFTFLLIMSFSAAFIPSSPFQSAFSRFIAFVCDQLFTKNERWRPVVVLLVSVGVAIGTMVLVLRKNPAFQAFLFFPIAGVYAVARKPKRLNNYSPVCGLPAFVLFAATTAFVVLAVTSYFYDKIPIYATLSSAGFSLFVLEGYCVMKLTRHAPNTLEADAVAWLLESSPSQKASLFRTAGQVASTTQRKAILLKVILPLLPPLISSRLRQSHGQLERSELETYLSCLAYLSDFRDHERSFWRNEAGIEHPTLPLTLLGQLEGLRKSSDPYIREAAESIWHNYSRLSGNVKGKEEVVDMV